MRFAVVCLAVFAGLTACGGGTSQFEPFVPLRLIAFGDETSTLTVEGAKYGVNAGTTVDGGDGTTVTTLDCAAQPIWVQSMASFYGFVFAECNPGQQQTPKAFMRASPGAKVADVQVQINAQLANGGFRDRDITTLLVGANDIIELYLQYPARPEPDLTAELQARGRLLAQQVNLLVTFGAKVIISTVPDMGLTPFARKQKAEFNDSDRAALLSRLTSIFNEQLGVNILLDGRFVGLVQADLRTQAMVKSPGSFGLTNVTDAACQSTSPLPLCNASTLVENANAGTWLWADDFTLGFPGQGQLTTLAVDRARRNPF